ncbi:MAG: hypothetical protein WC011_00160 [Candidatus Paceibacterota bacterium]
MNKSVGLGSFFIGAGVALIFTLNLNDNSVELIIKFCIGGLFVVLPYFLIISSYDISQIRYIDDLSDGKKFTVICKFENMFKDNTANYSRLLFIVNEVKDYDFFLISMSVKDYNSTGTKEEFFFCSLNRSISLNLEDYKTYFKKEGKFFLLEE